MRPDLGYAYPTPYRPENRVVDNKFPWNFQEVKDKRCTSTKVQNYAEMRNNVLPLLLESFRTILLPTTSFKTGL